MPVNDGVAGARVQRRLVDADVEHLVGVGEDLLRPVAVVHVPVEDQHPLRAALGDRVRGGHRDVVEQAEAHRPVALGVVPGRPKAAERSSRVAGEQALGRPRGAPPRSGAPPRRSARSATVSWSIMPPPARAKLLDRVDVSGIVDALERLAVGGGRLGALRAEPVALRPWRPRPPPAAPRSPGAGRCRGGARRGGRRRGPLVGTVTPRLAQPTEASEFDVAVVGRRRRRPVRGDQVRRGGRTDGPRLAQAARRELELLGAGWSGGGAGARRLARAAHRRHPERGARALQARGRGGARPRRRRRTSPSCKRAASASTRTTRAGSPWGWRAGTPPAASSTPAAARPGVPSPRASPSGGRHGGADRPRGRDP